MSRLKRKNRTDIEFKGCSGITDMMDDAVKQSWRINDEEFDFICDLEDKYGDALVPNPEPTISELKNSLRLIDEALVMMKK